VPVEQVAELLQRWQQAGGVWGRGRVLGDGVRLVAGLSPDERRLLARAVADEGAPQLAARIEDVSGHGVQPSQLQGVVDGLLSLDRDQVDHLVTTLSDPAERERLAGEALAQVAATSGSGGGPPPGPSRLDAPPPSGPPTSIDPPPGTSWPAGGGIPASDHDAPGPPLPPPVPFEPDTTAADDLALTLPDARAAAAAAGLGGVAGLHALARGEIPAEDVELADLALGHPGLGSADVDEPGLGSADVHEAGLHDVGIYDLDEHAIVHPLPDIGGLAAGTSPPDATPDPTARGPAVALPTAAAETAPAQAAPGVTATGVRPASAPSSGLDDRRDAAAATDRLVADLAARSTARERLATLDPGRIGDLDGRDVLRVLDAVPEGWQRRRAARRLLDADALGRAQPTQVAARFPALGDRTFVVGDLLAAGVITGEDLDGLLPGPVAARLRARSER
jgi:hypothetical protein